MSSKNSILRVTYMERRETPLAFAGRVGPERIAVEALTLSDYLVLYRRVGESLRWDQRLQMPEQELAALLNGGCLKIHVMRNVQGEALGFCEFDRSAFPQIELKNFGLVPAARGRGLGPRLLSEALRKEWECNPTRIWLHTDTWDHPSAVHLYQRAGFHVYAVREEEAGSL
jgi:ribosomal protein S18 acetylase RimI-like enzyme